MTSEQEIAHLFERVKQSYLKLERGQQRGLPLASLENLLRLYFVALAVYHYARDAPRLVGGEHVPAS